MGHERVVTTGALALVSVLGLAEPPTVQAGDHGEAPGTLVDPIADLCDLYAWITPEDTLVVALTFDCRLPPGQDVAYDPEVLYTIAIDRPPEGGTHPDNVDDASIRIQFGQDPDTRDWGVRVKNLPGLGGPVIGPVDQTIDAGGPTRVWAGLRDDPFFFDGEGLEQSIAGETLAFDNARDEAAGLNTGAIVLEMDAAAAFLDAERIRIWAYSGRPPT